METLEIRIKQLVKKSPTKILIKKLIETLSDFRLAKLNIAIQEELEKRIGEHKLDEIIYANNK